MTNSNRISIRNEKINISFDLIGGAIVDFSLISQHVNPLTFLFPEDTGGDTDYFYKGHFVCLPRWGDPTPGERLAGLNKHGDFIRLKWTARREENTLIMSAVSLYEDMYIERLVETDTKSSCVKIIERVRNENLSSRLYNMVQHPTIAAPFLDDNTVVDCNARTGFDYQFNNYSIDITGRWPELQTAEGELINLRSPKSAYSSVFSFIVNLSDEFGWITASSPTKNLMIGYFWKRADYPWINHWLHFENGQIMYRGLEFGTTGIHKPINELFAENLFMLLGQQTLCLLDADEVQERSYYMFLQEIPESWNGVENMAFHPECIIITERETLNKITISHQLNNSNGI